MLFTPSRKSPRAPVAVALPYGAGKGGQMDRKVQLATVVRAHADEIEAWQGAELHLLEQALRERLELLGVELTPDVAVALMATATLLGEHAPEWGGDVRCSLGEIALLGLRLLEGEPPASAG
jgi:hypothetical protein